MSASQMCPLTGLYGIEDEVYRAMVFTKNPFDLNPWFRVSDICKEVYALRRIAFIHEKAREEHPSSFLDRLVLVIPVPQSKIEEPQPPTEGEVSAALERLIEADRVRRLSNGGYVRSIEDLPPELRHLVA